MPISLIKKNQLDPNIADLVGQYGSGFFLPITVSGQLTGFIENALQGLNVIFVTTGQTGAFYGSSNPSGYVTTGDLSSTGLALISSINSLSGTVTSIYATYSQLTGLSGYDATVTNLATTGSTLSSLISSLSGTVTENYYPNANPSGFITGTNSLNNNGYQVYLDGNGMLNFPISGVLGDTYGDGGITLLSPSGKYSELASNDGNVYAWVADTDYGNPYGGGFAIGTNHTGNGYMWSFGNDGLLYFPDGSTQSGAYTGINLSNYVTNQQTGSFITAPSAGSYYISLIPSYDMISVTSTDVNDNPLVMTLYKSSSVVGYFNQTFSGNLVTQSVLTDASNTAISTWNVVYDASGKFMSVSQM